jgi:murein L,D-transpeptidase YcbB/YkuD
MAVSGDSARLRVPTKLVNTFLAAVGSLMICVAGSAAPKPATKPAKRTEAKKAAGVAKPAAKPGVSAASKSSVAGTATHPAGHHTTKHHKPPRIRGQAAPTSDRISEIQAALVKAGAYSGDPSGKWDDSSISAMKKFQQENGLEPSGKLDALTLQKLGLGSDIAGRAAPRPVAAPRSASSPSALDK